MARLITSVLKRKSDGFRLLGNFLKTLALVFFPTSGGKKSPRRTITLLDRSLSKEVIVPLMIALSPAC